MCYDVSYLTKRAEKYAERYGTKADWEDIKKRLPPTYHTQGFEHADLPVIRDLKQPVTPMEWGLVPRWVKDPATATKLSNSTLNARSENMFNKPSYRSAARKRHCLVIVDGFFEHHWYKGKSYPHYIQKEDDAPMALGGLWEEWQGKQTVSIITTKANPLMTHIHNQPKASHEPRMPFIVPLDKEEEWLQPIDSDEQKEKLYTWIGPYTEVKLSAFPVDRLRGKAYAGNVRKLHQKHLYPELESQQQGLF